MNEWGSPFALGTVVLAVVVIVLVIWMAVLGRRLKKLRKQYVQFMGQSGVSNLEEVLLDLRYALDTQADKLNEFESSMGQLGKALRQVKGNVGIHRYNAFADHGSDMSFSVAIVDEAQNGVVLSGLHARDETYMYAKPLKEGASAYSLTPEEQKAINLALRRE
ncbi:DUF4446 family protein [Paenibacillus beijingensis]|uniref:DUF4446 domain-containing protein n=1 Tax=Paenibacillus beijingensis TaxID=1126833 RepID=A0A0D5NIR6_9BACL|nr:DUF4446 family protein [Paenibacillus beijingensis]AJY74882.1 hypothetical protein VN24_10135 [Paenibacillus beijingensis]